MERLDGLAEDGTDHLLQLLPGQRDLGLPVRQEDRDADLDIPGERLLGVDTLLAEPGGGRNRHGVVRIEFLDGTVQGGPDMLEDGFIDVDAPQVLDALRRAQDVEPDLGPAHDRRVECPAAEVVDGHRLSGLHLSDGCVVGRRGLRFRDGRGIGDVRQPDGLLEQVELVGAPVGGVAHRDVLGGLPQLFGDPIDHPPQHVRHQGLGRHRAPAQEKRCAVAHPPLELTGDPARVAHGASGGGLTDEQIAIVTQVDHGRDHRGAVAQGDDLGPPLIDHGGRREGRPEIHPQEVPHARLLTPARTDTPSRSDPGRPQPVAGRSGPVQSASSTG